MIDSIGCSQRVNVNPGIGQRLTHARERAGTISKENCQLRGCFRRRGWDVRSCCKLLPASALTTDESALPNHTTMEHRLEWTRGLSFDPGLEPWMFGVME